MSSKTAHIFEEGKYYTFTLTGKVVLPPDDEEFFVLKSQFDSRHLLKYLPYHYYGLEIDREVRCRIDKISCSGKMYLEPEHKDYKENNTYTFRVKGYEEILNSEGKAERFLRLLDVNEQPVMINIGDSNPRDYEDTVLCRVDRIKKGKLYLTLARAAPLVGDLVEGKSYEFLISDRVTLAEDEEYFVLQDEFDDIHYLRQKYFEDYGLETGTYVTCLVIDPPKLFTHYLEPVHPFYKTGESYLFIVSGIQKHTNEFGEEVIKIMVTDTHQKEYFADCDTRIKDLPKAGETIQCLVDGIRMSKLKLTCI